MSVRNPYDVSIVNFFYAIIAWCCVVDLVWQEDPTAQTAFLQIGLIAPLRNTPLQLQWETTVMTRIGGVSNGRKMNENAIVAR